MIVCLVGFEPKCHSVAYSASAKHTGNNEQNKIGRTYELSMLEEAPMKIVREAVKKRQAGEQKKKLGDTKGKFRKIAVDVLAILYVELFTYRVFFLLGTVGCESADGMEFVWRSTLMLFRRDTLHCKIFLSVV